MLFMAITEAQLKEYIDAYNRGEPLIPDEEKEIWEDISYRDIKSNMYQVSSYGRICRKDTLKLMTPNIRGNGYAYVRLAIIGDGGYSRIFTIHRIVAYHFCDGYDMMNANIVNHIDGVKINNFYKNLEWCDQKHNAQHAFDTGLHKAKYGEESNRHSISNELAERICKMLIEYNGSVKPILDTLIKEGIYCTFSIIESIKQKETWSHISDKYFTKDFFRNLIEEDVKNICENIVKYNGNRDEILKHTKTKTISLDRRFLSDIITKSTYKEISDNYFTRDDFIFKKNFSEDDIHHICELLVKYKGDVYMVYDDLKDEVPNITTDRIADIKRKGSYTSISDQYFEQSQFNTIDVEDLDFIRELLMTETFKYSPTQVYDALNHKKYSRLTLNVIRMINLCSHDVYNKYKRISIEYFMDHKNRSIYSEISNETLSKLINSYNAGFSDITDSSYDKLLEEYLKANGEDKRPYLRQKQSGVVNELVCTLSKVYGTTEPMREGQDTYEKWFYRKGINPNAKIIIQPKFDGASIAVDKAGEFFTRGDYQNGESVNVTELFKEHNIKKYMREAVDGVKFEAIMPHEVFYSAGIDEIKGYLKPLDVVNAIIHSRNSKVSEYITLVPLRESVGGDQYVCSELKSISLTTTADDFDTIQQFIVDKLNDGAIVEYNGLHYSIDGVVVSVLGPDNQTQEEIAIKILNDVNETKLIDVMFQFGKTGKITPVAIVEPVQFCDGKRTVDHITVSTLDRVNEMNLRKGDTVRVMYNIVPYLLESKHDGYERIQLPTHCPKCGAPFEYTSLKTVRCTNPICQGRKLGSIIRYCEKMKMLGVGESTITTLFDEGFIKNIDDLYTLTVEDITSLPGFKETSAKNIIKSIHDNSQDVPVCRWLGALPFLDVDSKKWELLITSVLGNDEMYRSNVIRHIFTEAQDEFDSLLVQSVRGIGTATLKSMNEGFISNKDMFKRLIRFITFKSTTNVSNKGRVCLTGTRDKTVIDYLTKKGYQVTDSLTKDTVLVVRPDPMFESGKTKKAYDLGIKIITINEALGL